MFYKTFFCWHEHSSADFSSQSPGYDSHSFRLRNFIVSHVLKCSVFLKERVSLTQAQVGNARPQVASVHPFAVGCEMQSPLMLVPS